MDVVAVESAARRAIHAIRKGEGPVFLECRTYRFRPHSMFDAQLYRDKSEIEAWRKCGPIVRFGAWVQEAGLAHDENIVAIENEVAREIEECVEFAEQGTWEAVADLEKFVYMDAVP
jgi:TPP-dependent pyruvate/acetoin dehydrogenase alpha subunit